MEVFRKIINFIGGSVQFIVVILVLLLLVYVFIIQPHEVDGSSMHPTFKDNELLLSNLLDVRLNNIKKGDVVVFHSPVEEDKLYIKRVIATPGDSISLRGGYVFLNGELLDESAYLTQDVKTYPGAFLLENQVMTVPKGSLFVMGDNRGGSSDSREFGFLDQSKLIGRSLLRFWPIDSFQVISNPYK